MLPLEIFLKFSKSLVRSSSSDSWLQPPEKLCLLVTLSTYFGKLQKHVIVLAGKLVSKPSNNALASTSTEVSPALITPLEVVANFISGFMAEKQMVFTGISTSCFDVSEIEKVSFPTEFLAVLRFNPRVCAW